MTIQVKDVVKNYTGTYGALNGVSFSVKEGEMIGFLGPSGSGKTTLLRIIAGLERQTSGEVTIKGHVVDAVPSQRRGVGFVFQNYALFKHMTVFENVAFGLRVKKLRSDEIRARVSEVLRLVHLDGFDRRYPQALSGGQAQRVALARALAPSPSVLLLDEPFSAIDAQVRRELRKWIRQVHEEIGITSIFVTHDQEEALEVADRVLVMNQGRIEQFGTPKQVYDEPASFFVASFVGDANQLAGHVYHGTIRIGSISLPVDKLPDGSEAHVVVRPSDIEITSDVTKGCAAGTVHRTTYKGTFSDVEIRLDDGSHIRSFVAPKTTLKTGQRVGISIRQYRVFQQHPPFGMTQ